MRIYRNLITGVEVLTESELVGERWVEVTPVPAKPQELVKTTTPKKTSGSKSKKK